MRALDRPLGALTKTLTHTFGASGTYVVPGEPAYNPDTLTTDPGEPTEYSVRWTPAEQELGRMGLDPGTLVEKGQKAVLVAEQGLPVEPSTAHQFVIRDEAWTIDQVVPGFTGEQRGYWILVLESA